MTAQQLIERFDLPATSTMLDELVDKLTREAHITSREDAVDIIVGWIEEDLAGKGPLRSLEIGDVISALAKVSGMRVVVATLTLRSRADNE